MLCARSGGLVRRACRACRSAAAPLTVRAGRWGADVLSPGKRPPLLPGLLLPPSSRSNIRQLRHAAQNAQPAVVLVDSEIPAALRRGAANLARLRALPLRGLNVRDVVWAHALVVTRAALGEVNAELDPARDRRRRRRVSAGAEEAAGE